MCKLGILEEEFLRGYVNNSFKANIKNTPEQISAFIMEYGVAGNITITDSLDIAVITTFGTLLNRCSDQEYLLKHLRPILIPLQTAYTQTAESAGRPAKEGTEQSPKTIKNKESQEKTGQGGSK